MALLILLINGICSILALAAFSSFFCLGRRSKQDTSGALPPSTPPSNTNTLPSLLLLVSSLLLLLVSMIQFFQGQEINFQAAAFFKLGLYSIHFHLDRLAAVFLLLLALLSIALSFFSAAYIDHLKERIQQGPYWACFFTFLLALVLLILSSDAITFMIFWELMALSSVALVASEYKIKEAKKAALIYLAASKIATAFIAAGFFWLYVLSGSFLFSAWHFERPESLLPALLLFTGFSIKAGVWPFHVWLPYAHPAAPAPVSALMSGAMIKVAIYAIIRVLIMGQLNSALIAYLAIFLGIVSTFWGVLFALVQNDLKKLLAYCSVENIGIIMLTLGLSLLARSAALHDLAALCLAASIFHAFNHGVFKSLLFLSAGAVDASAHSRELARLGGLAKNMPFTASMFLLGSIAICALPPLNGFASKWLVYKALLASAYESLSLVNRGIFLALICMLAVVGGLGLAAFCKAYGVAFLGNPRSKEAEHAHRASRGMKSAQFMLAVISVLLGLFAGQVLAFLSPILSAYAGKNLDSSSYFEIPLAGLAIALLLLTFFFLLLLKNSKVKTYITWECGFGDLSPRTQVNPGSFVQPLARIFSSILAYKINFEIAGRDRRHFPERIKVEPRMFSYLEKYFYAPLIALFTNSAKALARIQAGSIHLYLLYLCFTLVFLLIMGTQL